jgi:predicted DNA binding protein
MSVIGEFTIPAESFVLEETLSAAPDLLIEVDRLASHGPHQVFPFLWMNRGDGEKFQQVLEADPAIRSVSIAEQTDTHVLYLVMWVQEFHDLIQQIVDHHAAIIQATARDNQWELQLRFAREEQVTEFQQYFREEGKPFTVRALARPTDSRQPKYGLTEEQYDAVVTAVRAGYFQVPRTTTAEAVGDTLDISANAVSQRLRRGVDTLVRDTLVMSDDA